MYLHMFLIALSTSVLTSAATFFITKHQLGSDEHPKVVTVDLKHLYTKHIDQVAKDGLDTSKMPEAADIYKKRLSGFLNRLSRETGAVVLVSPAVISNVPDYTNEAEDYLLKRKGDSK